MSPATEVAGSATDKMESSMNDIERKSIELAAQSGEAYPVDFDQAWQWIGYSRKDHAKTALLSSFADGVDFSREFGKSSGGRPSEEIRMSKNCFKQFCMMARTDKGREVRQYFIQCEEKLQTISQVVSQPGMSLEEMAVVVITGMQKKIAEQQAVIEEQRPAVEYVQRYVSADGSLSFRKAAAVLGIPERQFIAELISRKFVYRDQSGHLCAYSEHLRSGLFTAKTGTGDNGHAFSQTRITPHGMTYLARLFGGAA